MGRLNVMCSCVGCTDNKMGQVGAQLIGDGLKSLKSLKTLNLKGVMCDE